MRLGTPVAVVGVIIEVLCVCLAVTAVYILLPGGPHAGLAIFPALFAVLLGIFAINAFRWAERVDGDK